MFALRDRAALEEAGITHVVTVLRGSLEKSLFEDFKHLVVEVDDTDDENLVEHFATTHRFIADALASSGGGVLIHWCALFSCAQKQRTG